MTTRLQLIGGGRMGEALLGGLLAAGWAEAGELAVVERIEGRRKELADRFGGVQVVDEPVASDGAVIAVKPGDVPDACRAATAAGVRRVLSIAAGVTIADLEGALGAGVPVVRAMPNTPALVGAGAAPSRRDQPPARTTWCGPKGCWPPSAPWCGSPSTSSTR